MFCEVMVSLLLPRFHLKDSVPEEIADKLENEKELLVRHWVVLLVLKAAVGLGNTLMVIEEESEQPDTEVAMSFTVYDPGVLYE